MTVENEHSVFEDIETFIDSTGSIVLSTVGSDGQPDTGVAPFVRTGAGFGLFVSDLAVHTQNMRAMRPVSALLLEDESLAKSPFARRRLSLTATPQILSRHSEPYEEVTRAFSARHAAIMDVLTTLGDFHAFILLPTHLKWVSGFAKTYLSATGRVSDLRLLQAPA